MKKAVVTPSTNGKYNIEIYDIETGSHVCVKNDISFKKLADEIAMSLNEELREELSAE